MRLDVCRVLPAARFALLTFLMLAHVILLAAAEAAVSAAEKILTQSVKGDVADRLIAQGISDVKSKLN